MNKIIAAFDGLKFSESTKEYAIALAKISGAHLVGIFLDDKSYTSYKIYELVDNEGLSVEKQNLLDQRDEQKRKYSEKVFFKACEEAGINFSVHHDRKMALNELLHETIYSDLLIINASETLTHYEEKLPTRFIEHLLSDAHCPVLLVPEKYKQVEKVIFLYDGEPSSMHAIKTFSCVLDSLNYLPCEVISVKTVNQSLHVPDNKLIKEFMKRHFVKITYTVLKGEAQSELLSHLKTQTENPLIILGAYHRSKLSRWIEESMADILLKNIKAPLFVAHE